jgi:hypothetical protein
MVVDPTCNASNGEHAEAIAKAVDRVDAAELDKVSDRKLSFLHFTTTVG